MLVESNPNTCWEAHMKIENKVISIPERIIRLETINENINQTLIRIESKIDKVDDEVHNMGKDIVQIRIYNEKIKNTVAWMVKIGSVIGLAVFAQLIKLFFHP